MPTYNTSLNVDAVTFGELDEDTALLHSNGELNFGEFMVTSHSSTSDNTPLLINAAHDQQKHAAMKWLKKCLLETDRGKSTCKSLLKVQRKLVHVYVADALKDECEISTNQ